MRIAVMGAGGMGGYLGAKLARGGHDVALIARGAHLEALRRRGLRISGAETLEVTGVQATDRPAEIGVVDAVLFCVKLYDTDAAAPADAPRCSEKTPSWSRFRTGSRARPGLPRSSVRGGRWRARRTFPPTSWRRERSPGSAAWRAKPLIAFGEPGEGPSQRAHAFAQVCNEAGVDAAVFDDTERMIWEKFCLMAGSSAATALVRQPIGPVRSDPDARWMLAQAVSEAAAVGRGARGCSFPGTSNNGCSGSSIPPLRTGNRRSSSISSGDGASSSNGSPEPSPGSGASRVSRPRFTAPPTPRSSPTHPGRREGA